MRLPPLPLRRVSASAVAGATLVALLCVAPGASVANESSPASPSESPSDSLPGTSGRPFDRTDGPVSGLERRAAARALADARAVGEQATGAGTEGREASIVLRDLALVQDDLTPADQTEARRILARPTAARGDGYLDYADDARVTSDCVVRPVSGSKFCIHWARRTRDAPPPADADRDRVPNQVEVTRTVFDYAWSRLVQQGGYVAPPADGRGPKGYRNRFDVYLGDLGSQGLYGYCVPETVVSSTRATSYCAVDDDFSTAQFPGTPRGNLKVTGAHEFFHAVQFGMDWTEDGFFMENSSTWVEDELYDGVNDNHNYFEDSSLLRPGAPLDLDHHWYGNWIWLRFLTETFPDEGGSGLPTLVRDAWDRADTRSTYSVQALADALAARGGQLPELLADFATANRFPAVSYEEGGAYPAAPSQRSVSLATSTSGTATVDHLASATVQAVPASAVSSGSRLRITLNAPSLPADLQVNVARLLPDGSREVLDVALDGAGDAVVTVPFAPDDTRRVDVTLANGGTDYTCWTGGSFACQGFSLDDGRAFAYQLAVLPPSA